jgi:hypothetical protein
MSGTATRTAFVAEDGDPEDVSRFAGTFSVHWEDTATREWQKGPEGVGVEEAIEWGRRHADVVQVLIGADEVPFSAGSRQPAGEVLPTWPPEGVEVRPRPVGSPHDGSVQVVVWSLRSEARTPAVEAEDVERIRDSLERAPEIERVVSVEGTGTGVAVVFAIAARSERDAVQAGHELVRGAVGEPVAVRTTGWQAD